MDNFLFTCPHCNKDINFDEVKNHNKVKLDDFFNLKKEQFINEQKKEIIAQLNNEKQLELKLKESEFEKKISLIQSQLEQANLEKQRIKLDAEKDVQIKMNEQINALQNEISKLRESTHLQIENVKKDEQIKFESEKLKLIGEYQTQIKELEIKNAEHRLIKNKTKGENWENEFEGELRKCFGLQDRIVKANETKEGTKPDFLQYIKSKDGKEIGLIVHEVKNANWSNAWEKKLYMDIVKNEGRFGILTATSFEDKFIGVPFIKSDVYDNVWITNKESFPFVAQMLRQIIIIENSFKQKNNELSNALSSTQNEQIEKIKIELEKKKEKLNNFLSIDVAKASEICRTELNNLEGVTKTLAKQGEVIEKAHTRIRAQLFNKIIEKITQIAED